MKDYKTRNFTLAEAIHSDRDSFPEELLPIAYCAMGTIQSLRDVLQIPITITSGYRSSGHNQAIGGAKNSRHIWRYEPDGRMVFALDITSSKLTAQELFEKLKSLVNGETYLHKKLQFVHISPQEIDEEWVA